jgi:molecular chaperone GrpE
VHGKHNDKENHGRAPVNGGPNEPHVEPETEHCRPEEAATVDIDALAAELERARAEASEYQDKYVRLYAETENFRKRMTRDFQDRERYCNESIIKELLPVADNFDRALTHAGEGTGNEGLVEGVRMVKKQLMDVLAKFGVTQVESVGLPFDPMKQQAIMQVETEDYADGVVVEEFQKGYFLNDRILRPAMVTVAKRPGTPQAE